MIKLLYHVNDKYFQSVIFWVKVKNKVVLHHNKKIINKL